MSAGGGIEIELVSHASIIVDCGSVSVWTDPWLEGLAFNESWALVEAPRLADERLDEIDYVWISHEHPDHFHVPTLRALPDSFKRRVTVLVQRKNDDRVPAALRHFGFERVIEMPHRSSREIAPGVSVYTYHVGQMDSILGVRAGDQRVLDVNDAEIRSHDCALVLRDFGRPNVVLNQFSFAGYDGLPHPEKRMRDYCEGVLETVAANHRDLNADVTIPIASFVYFCTTDNAHLNRYVNEPRDFVAAFEREALPYVLLDLGERWRVGEPHDDRAALERYDALYRALETRPMEETPPVPVDRIIGAFHDRCRDLHAKYPHWVLRRLGSLTARLSDLDVCLRFSIAEDRIEEVTTDAPDLELMSQPFWYAFHETFGVQTLGVSGRLRLHGRFDQWRYHRILFSMYNANVYLRPRYFFSARNLSYLWSRSRGGLRQLVHQLGRVRWDDGAT